MTSRNIYAKVRSWSFKPDGSLNSDLTSNNLWGSETINRNMPSRRKPKGFKPPTSASASTADGHTNLYSYWSSQSVSTDNYTSYTQGSAKWPFTAGNASFDADLASRAELKALLNLKNQNINLAVSFAERAATAAMVEQTATTLAKAITAVRHLDVKRFKQLLGLGPVNRRDRKILKKAGPKERKARNLWLSYQYGWVPLLSDVQGAAVQLAQHDAAVPDRYRSTVKAAISKHTKTLNSSSFDTPWPKSITKWFTTIDQGAFVSLTYSLDNPVSAEAAQLGFTNPLSVAWELVPYSFVADWFYPIGDYINALDANVGWSFMGGSCSRRLRQRLTASADVYTISGYKSRSGGGHGVHNYRAFSRTTYSSPPVPDLVTPTNPFSGRRMMNAIALLSSACR